jgi:hypothetical protein
METLKALLDPTFLTVLAAAVALSYLVGEVNGEHPSPSSADAEGEGRGAAGVDRPRKVREQEEEITR